MRKLLLVALVFAMATPALAQAPGGAGGGKPKVPTRSGHLTAVLMREDGAWKVAAGRAMIPVPLVYREPQ